MNRQDLLKASFSHPWWKSKCHVRCQWWKKFYWEVISIKLNISHKSWISSSRLAQTSSHYTPAQQLIWFVKQITEKQTVISGTMVAKTDVWVTRPCWWSQVLIFGAARLALKETQQLGKLLINERQRGGKQSSTRPAVSHEKLVWQVKLLSQSARENKSSISGKLRVEKNTLLSSFDLVTNRIGGSCLLLLGVYIIMGEGDGFTKDWFTNFRGKALLRANSEEGISVTERLLHTCVCLR